MANVKTDTFSGGYGNTQHNARIVGFQDGKENFVDATEYR